MKIFNTPIRAYFGSREERIVSLYEDSLETQEKWFRYLVKNGLKTAFGKDHGFTGNLSYTSFTNNLPVQNYNTLYPYIERVIKGEDYVLWNSKTEWIAKSSGTTHDRSKYIPVTDESLNLNNYLSAKDSLTFYIELFPDTELFAGKAITLGGSLQKIEIETKLKCGDISAILMENMPFLGDFLNAAGREILLTDDWNEKLLLIAQHTLHENVTSLSGVPSWMLLVLKKILDISGKRHIFEVWENLEVFFHGGVAFGPYRDEYKKIIPGNKMFYMNMYNASEGFFGLQDQRNSDDLLLLSDNGVFFEFTEINEVGKKGEKTVPLSDVELGKNYAIIITTASGLWRYEIGDTVKFTSLHPFRFQITGRTAHYINVFGEELMVDNAEKAIAIACTETCSTIDNFTVAPIYLSEARGGHQWAIEFTKMPPDLKQFAVILDQALKSINSDYEAKRSNDLMLTLPQITILKEGAFLTWLEKNNKLGSQNKIPHLQNDRIFIEKILELSRALL